MTSPIRPSLTVEPRTKTGRVLVEDEPRLVTGEHDMRTRVLAIENEAGALSSEGDGPDYEAMRQQKGWPTPIAMRRAADGLDKIAIAHYGDILRWVANLCDGLLKVPGSSEGDGTLDVERLAHAIHAAEDPHLEGVSLRQREKAAVIAAEYAALTTVKESGPGAPGSA